MPDTTSGRIVQPDSAYSGANRFRDASSGETAKLTRSVKNAGALVLDPDTPEWRAVVGEALNHPELTLSRRELIKFIVAKPGDRAAEVQALLKLDRVESNRRALKAAQSKAASDAKAASGERDTAEQAFQQHLGVTTLLSTEVLREINRRRTTLGLTSLVELTADTDILSGVGERPRTIAFNIEGAKRDLRLSLKQRASSHTKPPKQESPHSGLRYGGRRRQDGR